MAFSDDAGGFAFSCHDAKMSIGTSTWNTRLSQLSRVSGPMLVMTGLLPDITYISQIIGKRPRDIFIIASTEAEAEARLLKQQFPEIRVALHKSNNAKVVLVAPDTVWVSSSDFGKSAKTESAVGMHSEELYNRTLSSLFNPVWAQSTEIK